MINIGVISDIQWDNYILISKKMKKIDPENYRLHIIYNKNNILNRCCRENNLYILNHSGQFITSIVNNLIKICDLWIVFTNYTEYLNIPSLIMDACNFYNIPYIVVSEYSRELDYYSVNHTFKTFKKFLVNFKDKCEDNKECEDNKKEQNNRCLTNVHSLETLDLFNSLFNYKIYKHIELTSEILDKLKTSYANIEKQKQERSIKLLYDKSEAKYEKRSKRNAKEYKQLEFANNRLNYYKTSPK